MVYATHQDLIDRFGEEELRIAAGRPNDDGEQVTDVTAVQRALVDASSFIDTYLSRRYKTPLLPVPYVVVHLCTTIALYYLSFDAGPLTKEKRQRYDDAVKLLGEIADGTVNIAHRKAKREAVVSMRSSPRLFRRESLRGLM